jgi:3-deoxy-manno-octulosonate cytidylyltransferase (CMP-KDO synthetase)
MIEHVRRRVMLSSAINDVVVATCDREIADEVGRFGGQVVMTSEYHEGCIDRVCEAAQGFEAEVVINVQGDMPLVHPKSLEDLVSPLIRDRKLLCTDMMGPIGRDSEHRSPNVVKVVVDGSRNALYYSRAPIPSCKGGAPCEISRFKQFGINAFRRQFLLTFAELPRTPMERAESVDMLRAVEHGFKVHMVSSSYPAVGVDTQEDLEEATEMMQEDPVLHSYL